MSVNFCAVASGSALRWFRGGLSDRRRREAIPRGAVFMGANKKALLLADKRLYFQCVN